MIHFITDINERQAQIFMSRSNIYVCDNNGRDLHLLGVNALVNCLNKQEYCFIYTHKKIQYEYLGNKNIHLYNLFFLI